jgi:hypothetical protein
LVRRLGYTKASKQHRKAFIAGQANPGATPPPRLGTVHQVERNTRSSPSHTH